MSLTLQFYCAKQSRLEAWDSVAGHAKLRFLLGLVLVCAAALACSGLGRAEEQAPAVAGSVPIASAARLAGDTELTRFVLDLDKPIQFRAFALPDPDRVVIDIPQVNFRLPAGTGANGRGLIKAFRYGLVMPGASRIVMDLTGPARIANSNMLPGANGQPPRLVLELEQVDRATFMQAVSPEAHPENHQATTVVADAGPTVAAPETTPATKPVSPDSRPVVVIDPGHGGVDNGTQSGDEAEKSLVLAFALTLRDRLEQGGKYRVVMTRADDTFIPLNDRVKIARSQSAALFVSIHADALPKHEGDAQGATIYTVSDKATDAEAAQLAETENRADAIGGVNLSDEPTDVADILIDLAQRETRTFSNRFARLLMNDMKTVTRMHKHPLKSAGFRVLKAPDVPSVLVELGYVSNKGDLAHLVSENWRERTAAAMAEAIDTFLAKREAYAAPAN